jgi:formate-dependent nitrite reductase membrane component NrfD
LTGVLLIKDLDQPKRFLYVLLRPHWTSWLVKGGYTITAYGGLVTLWGVLKYFELASLADLLLLPILILSVLLAVYTAFLFGQAKGRDFWQSPLLSVHMLLHAVVGGSAALLLMSAFWTDLLPLVSLLKGILFWSLVVQLFSFAAEFLSSHPTEDAAKAAYMITHGTFRTKFWGGVVIVGNVIPLLLFSLNPGLLTVAAASVLVLIGVWLSVRIWVLAPQMLPLS